MSSTGSKVQTQKNTGSESVGSRKKSSSRSTGSVTGKHIDAVTASAGLDATVKSINNPVGLVPALGYLKPEDLSCVDKPEELVFGLPYIPPVNIPALESRLEKAGRISGLDFAETVSPPTVDKIMKSNSILADSLVNDTGPCTGHSLPGTCHLVGRSVMSSRFTGNIPVPSDSTLHQTDFTPISPRFTLLEPTVNKFKLTDNPSFLQAVMFADNELMPTDRPTRPISRDFMPTSDFRQTDAKSISPNVTSSCIKFMLAGTGPAFLDPSFPGTVLVSSRPGSTGKAFHDPGFAKQSCAGITETTSAQMPASGADQTQTTESRTQAQNADSLAQETVASGPKNIPDQCLGFKRRSPPRQSGSCNDCSEEEKMLMVRHNFSQEQLAELKESYFYFASPSEQLHETNFGRSLRAIGQNPSEEDIKKMLVIAHVRSEDGYITLDNYLKAVGCWGLRSEVDMIEDLIQAFKVFDEADDERLDSVKIRAALKNYAEPLDEEDISQLLQLADNSPSGDGKLGFLRIIKTTAAHYNTQNLRTNASSK